MKMILSVVFDVVSCPNAIWKNGSANKRILRYFIQFTIEVAGNAHRMFYRLEAIDRINHTSDTLCHYKFYR